MSSFWLFQSLRMFERHKKRNSFQCAFAFEQFKSIVWADDFELSKNFIVCSPLLFHVKYMSVFCYAFYATIPLWWINCLSPSIQNINRNEPVLLSKPFYVLVRPKFSINNIALHIFHKPAFLSHETRTCQNIVTELILLTFSNL